MRESSASMILETPSDSFSDIDMHMEIMVEEEMQAAM
jgi:hypothetical protein